jgi:acetoin utilization deacetylase AcuC-like enzyme
MNRTGLVYHEDYLKHDAGEHHPEKGERLTATMEYFRDAGIMEKLTLLRPEPCSDEDILRAHARELLEEVKDLSASGGGSISEDTYCSPETYYVARLAAGGCIKAGESVMRGGVDNAFALVRPPGHHAGRNKAGGFCFFNNAAVMIKYLQAKHGIKRVFLFDWDAHAGNGTMDIFYDDPSVLNVSIHQDPRRFYPNTGFLHQIGRDKGEGYTVNIPVPAGTGDADYIHILKDFVIPLMKEFRPDFVVVSAGQDSHDVDAISGLCLTEDGFGEMTRLLLEEAKMLCSGRMVVELEGGYELDSFVRSNYAIVSALLGLKEKYGIKGEVRESTDAVLHALHETHLSGGVAPEAP